MHWQALCNFSLDCVHEKRGSGVTDMTKSIVQYCLSCYICVNDSTVYFSLIYECGYSFPWSEWVTSCMCVPFHAFTWRNYCSKSCDVKIKNNLTSRIIVQNPIPLPHVTLGEWVTQWYECSAHSLSGHEFVPRSWQFTWGVYNYGLSYLVLRIL